MRSFFWGPGLSGNAARTFRFHLAYALLDATAGGILLNAPIVAIKAFEAANWHLPLREFYAGLGMIATLYLAGRMASRPKMPYVVIPGLLAAGSSLGMALATGSAFWFLTLLGIGAMLEILTRPAVTAILRLNYPVEHRGYATGAIRSWSSLAFVASSMASALLLHWSGGMAATGSDGGGADPWSTARIAQWLMIAAGSLNLASFLCFRQIRVDEIAPQHAGEHSGGLVSSLRGAWQLVAAKDGRFRRYLLGCFLDGFCQMLYLPLIWAFLSRDLGYGYLGSVALMHALPALAAFFATGGLGRQFDWINPWVSWAAVRFLWGLDALLLAATPVCAAVFPPALVLLPVCGRILRGSVQGGWWILYWQVGVTYFAPPGEDTSRYMGVMVFLNGMIRLLASAAGMLLMAAAVPPVALLAAGGLGVVLSGAYSLRQAGREVRQHGPQTITEFEHQFGIAARHL